MLDPGILRSDTESVRQALKNRGHDSQILEDFIHSDSEWRQAMQEVDRLKQERKQLQPKGKPSEEEMKTLATFSEKIKGLQQTVDKLEQQTKEYAHFIPNNPDPDVPIGKNEEENIELRIEGKKPTFDFDILPHDELGENLGILDFDSAAKMSGSRFSVLKGLGAKLERALIQFMLDTHTQNGYEEHSVPFIIKTEALTGTGQLPKFAEDLYQLQDSQKWLSPTAEVQLTNLYRESIVSEESLPIKLTAASSCFRSEAGSYGKDIKGLIRQHQFQKVELVQIVHPEQSRSALEGLLKDAESILQALELPYRVVSLCTGDLGFAAAKTFDLEVWFPSQNCYREISSCSNFLDFQARRAMIRYKGSQATTYAHTLNGSGLAIGRTIAAILENYQTSNGDFTIPQVLQSYIKE